MSKFYLILFTLVAFALPAFSQCSISITSPTNGATVSGPTALTATTSGCAPAIRYEWRINGMPMFGDGTYENSFTVPTCVAGACTGTYQMPSGFGFYNVSYNWDATYSLTVMAEDAAGTVLATSSAVTFTVNEYGFGACTFTSPNLAVAQSGTINVTTHCPLTGTTGTVFANPLMVNTIDGLDFGDRFRTGWSDLTLPLDTTTLEDGKHLLASSATNQVAGAQGPLTGAIGILITNNGNVTRELRLSSKSVYLWQGSNPTYTFSARTISCTNVETPVTATYTSSDSTVVSVTGAVATAVAPGVATITGTFGAYSVVANVTVMAGTPIFPHLGSDGSVCTGYNVGNCAGGKSHIWRWLFDGSDYFGGNVDTGLPAALATANFNTAEHSFYVSPANQGYPSLSTWKTLQDSLVTTPVNTGLIQSRFGSWVGRCSALGVDGAAQQQSSADTNVADSGGFAARMAYVQSTENGKVISCIYGDEYPGALPWYWNDGVIGHAHGPTKIVVSGGTASVYYPCYHNSGAGGYGTITNSTNSCLNATGFVLSGGSGDQCLAASPTPFTMPTSCPNGTYAPGGPIVETGFTFNAFDGRSPCPSTGCAGYGPLNIAIPNNVFASIATQLNAFAPPIQYDIPWQGGAQKLAFQAAASVQGVAEMYWVPSAGTEAFASIFGLPQARTLRSETSIIEGHFWTDVWPGVDRTKPMYMETGGASSWYARGGATYTLGATNGSQFTTTTPNIATVGGVVTTRINVSGSSCDGLYDVVSIQSSTTFTVSQTLSCTGSGGTVVIAPATRWFTPPYDKLKRSGLRAIDQSLVDWECIMLGFAGCRGYDYNRSDLQGSNFHNYPAPLTNAYTAMGLPAGAGNEQNATAITYVQSDSPSADNRWKAKIIFNTLEKALEPQVVQPMCTAPHLGNRISTGAKCGAAGTLIIAINDNEAPYTVTFPASLWSVYNVGSAAITRMQQISAAYMKTTNLASSATSDSFVASVGEVDLWWFPAGATPLTSDVTLQFNPGSVGATKTALQFSPVCDPQTLATNLDQQASWTVFGSSITLPLDLAISPLCYRTRYLDNSNVPVGAVSPVQVLTFFPIITTTSPLPSAMVNTAYTDTLMASGAGPITWSGTSGTLPPGLCLSVSTGVISGTPTTLGTFTFTLTATNSFGSNSKTFTLAIGGGAPVITTTSPLPAANLNLAYSTTVAAAGAAPITWSLSGGSLPNGLALNASTGVISGTPTVAATFNFTLTATNVVGSASSTFSLTVNALPAITTASPLPAATVGIAYSTPLTATGTTPITWAVTVGSLPTGLALNASTGLISGTPTVIGTSNFTITATNSVGNNAKAFTLSINGVAPVITTASPLPAATQNTGYSTPLAATGSTPITWSVTAGTLPTGLSLTPSTGVISGTPTVIGTTSFTMTATNTAGSNAKAFTLTVNGLAPVITTASPLPAATQNTNYSAPLTATGSTPITWTVTVGSLPAGLALSAASGVISGIPSGTGTSSFTVTATNAAGINAKAFSLTVNGVQPTITTSSPLPGGTQNSAYSTTLAATGTTPITWGLTVGSLPTGLSLNTSTGVISGTPTGTGTSNFTIQATNVAGANSKAFALTIAGIPPTITTSSTLPQGTQSTAYSTTLAATGTTPITWALTVGTLPTGLSLNTSTGVISGTPSGSGTSSFTILATNSAGSFSQAFALTIASAAVAPTIATGSPLPQANQNVFYTAGLQATGTAPFTWSVTAGTLPAGLSLDPNLGLISGTPTTLGTSTFTVKALNSAGSNSKSFTLTIATGGTTMRGSVILSGSQKVH